VSRYHCRDEELHSWDESGVLGYHFSDLQALSGDPPKCSIPRPDFLIRKRTKKASFLGFGDSSVCCIQNLRCWKVDGVDAFESPLQSKI